MERRMREDGRKEGSLASEGGFVVLFCVHRCSFHVLRVRPLTDIADSGPNARLVLGWTKRNLL